MSSDPTTARTTASSLQFAIRQDLINGVFPAGAKLRIRELAERYDVGTIPLREALSRLCNTGFIDAIDQKGFRVSDVSEDELLDITRTRQQLESLALREAISRCDGAWEGRVLAAYHQLKRLPLHLQGPGKDINPEWERAHDAFHETLISGCESKWLKRFCATMREQTARYRALSAGIGHAEQRDVDAEHAAIVDAIVQRNADRACQLLSDHFASTTRLVARLLQE
ncbi:GntR family transcriptional regulator [Pusillimonas noertemannii]|uniref:DNA-binding GntR family transcriptional regulator n=1 Tax=Pusillimonas noertemannii TaxID=305977 RepID=A0A2U1CP82_9BURK|nr:FCD domain-containing protein [Pusillimonas noertemannii]NYT67035.1 FCD domain-containing protein [Pusillimonas noertemannii]PVY67708.1 DNA-binding GntR family transcriptional regulator [Pusillimonas noertemannii]TFL12755.1 FCD domain-containing protein [Pusillimonas noertemannii]